MIFARSGGWSSNGKFSRVLLFLSPLLIVFCIVKPVESFFYSPGFGIEDVLFLEKTGYIFNLCILLYSIISIMNLEATLKSSSGIKRWNIKFMLMGIGVILSLNIFYYSHALLYRSLTQGFLPVRAGIILVAMLLLGISLLRFEGSDIKITVSRGMLFRSLSLLIVGIYLLGLGVIAKGMSYFSPEIGKNITTFFAFIGAIIALTIILSEQLRRKAKVFISKNFYRQKYDYREQWLKFTRRISFKHSFEDLLESIAEGFKDAIGVKGAAIWLKSKETGQYNCYMTDDDEVLPLKPNNDMIEFLHNNQWIINVQDKKSKEVVDNNIHFLEKTRASLVVPLMQRTDIMGFIVLFEAMADNEYNFEDYDLLKTLAKQAASAILNARLSEELAESKEIEAVGRISSFIVHDLKNAASMLSLTAQNAEEHIDDPDFQRDAIRTISNSADRIKKIIQKLKELPGNSNVKMHRHDLSICVKNAIKEMNVNGNSKITYRETTSVRTKFDNSEITKVINNLMLNALEATEPGGQVTITTGRDNNSAYVKVSDNGCGMSREFIEKRLFKPFQTTKKQGLGIGLYHCKAIVEAHSGSLKVSSQEGKGTDITLHLPLMD
jgi:putative PEP-CTERM system histidine kinase